MARGSLAAQTPLVPKDTFVSFDLMYRFLKELDADVKRVEGQRLTATSSKTSNTTLASEIPFVFPLKASQKVRIHGKLYTTGNIKLRHLGPASPVLVHIARTITIAASASAVLDSAYSAADIVPGAASVLEFDGLVYNGPTAGNFEIHWAQNASNATPSSLYAGSWMQYSLVD